MLKHNTWFWKWLFMLIWGVIWAGFFSLPRIIADAWVIPGIVIIVSVWALVIVLHLILAEVSLSLPWHKTFVGMANELFPPRMARFTSIITIINFFIGILAYNILGGTFLHTLLADIGRQVDVARLVLLYALIMGTLNRYSLSSKIKRNMLILWLFFICISIVTIYALWVGGDITTFASQPQNWFYAYGVWLFAMSSISTIPLLYHATWKSAVQIRNIIWCAGFIVVMCVLAFSLSTISISWQHTTGDAIQGLYIYWGKILGLVGSIIWLTAITWCYVPVSSHLKEILYHDEKLSKVLSWVTIIILPLLIYLYFDPTIVKVLWIAGSFLWWLLTIMVAFLNIHLHRTKQKVKIIPMIQYDQIWSRVLVVVCWAWVLYQIVSMYS